MDGTRISLRLRLHLSVGRVGVRCSPVGDHHTRYDVTTPTNILSRNVLTSSRRIAGATPYPCMSGKEIAEAIKVGYRMEQPKSCPPAL